MNDFLQRLFAIAIKEVRQLSRDRISMGMIVGIPLMQILLFGYAINFDIRHLPAAAVDLSNTAKSRAVIQDAVASQVIDIDQQVSDLRTLMAGIRSGELSVGLAIPADFDTRLQRGEAAVQLWVDGADPQILATAQQLASMPNPAHPVSTSPWISIRPYFNPERRTSTFIVPGLLGVVLTMTMIMFTAMAIVRERERGNLEFLITTPVRSSELMLGKILPYVAIGLLQFTIILLIGALIFDVPIRGSLLELYAAALLFIAASLSLGLVISTKASNQFQAMQLTFFVFLPSILLSGFMFPFAGMPRVVQWLAEILPLTHFLRIVRGILIRGADLSQLNSDMLAMTVFFIAMTIIAAIRFQKRLD